MATALPERYRVPDRKVLLDLVVDELQPGFDVLDMGSGRKPILPPGERPTTITYVGLDINPQEMEKAGEGGYDEVVIADIGVHQPSLDGRFDAVISFQVLEHVKPLDGAFSNVRLYLKPGGVFMAYFSGKFSIYGMLNQILPQKVSRFLLKKLLRRKDPSVYFPAYYHKCWNDALERLFVDWDDVSIVPIYRGASYFSWSKPVQRCYLAYENWLVRRDHRNLAGYYLISARRPTDR